MHLRVTIFVTTTVNTILVYYTEIIITSYIKLDQNYYAFDIIVTCINNFFFFIYFYLQFITGISYISFHLHTTTIILCLETIFKNVNV